ncbi:MAG TPA: rcc01693 family protein [Tianweitania sediminis]|nr:rcc01693 family protein [Tianweitania sediminis]
MPRQHEAFPWERAMALGLGLLRLRSADFWMMTPRELAAALQPLTGGDPAEAMPRHELDRLMQQFPDRA